MKIYMKENKFIKKFAWLPIKIERETRWLETVYIWKRSVVDDITDKMIWINYAFLAKEEYELKKQEQLDGVWK